MGTRDKELNAKIISLVCSKPGLTLIQIIDTVLLEGLSSKDTIRRRVYKLGALGYLSMRKETTVYPTKKGREAVA